MWQAHDLRPNQVWLSTWQRACDTMMVQWRTAIEVEASCNKISLLHLLLGILESGQEAGSFLNFLSMRAVAREEEELKATVRSTDAQKARVILQDLQVCLL